MNDFEMTSQVDRLRTMISNIVDEKLNNLPISLPAKVVKRNKSTVSVLPLITFGTLDPAQIDDVPIAKSPYLNEPLKAGDFGLLIPCSYFYQSIVTDGLTKIDSVVPTVTTGNYLFLPITQISADPSTGLETELWSNDLARYLRVKSTEIELGGTTGNVTEYAALNTALQTFVAAVNTALASKMNGSGSPGTLTLNIAGAKVTGVTV